MSENLLQLVFLAHLASTLWMTGLIWFVQVVHYPLFAAVGTERFAAYEQRHTVRTTFVVAPPMLVEALTAVALLAFNRQATPLWLPASGLVLLLVIWLSTAFLQVPCHKRLADGFETRVHRRLLRTNWLRTIAWTLRALLVLWMASFYV